MDLTNANTKSQKLRRISLLKNHIVAQIDNNQNIKRLSRYLSQTPLLSQGMSYDGKKIKQPDLVDSLVESVKQDAQASVTKPILIPYSFSEEILEEQQVSIYVHCPRTSFHTQVTGTHLFLVEIVFPRIYDAIEPYGEERNLLIASEILDMFDNQKATKELRDLVGEVEFKINRDVTTLRLGKEGYLITTVQIDVDIMTPRISSSR